MSLKIWIINIALAAAFLFTAAHAWDAWKAEPRDLAPSETREKSSAGRPQEDLTKPQMGEEGEYELVIVQNLFSPDRQEYIPEKPPEADADEEVYEPEVVEKPLVISGEKVVLYGVVISDNLKTAMINNPGGKLGEKKYLWIQEGQDLANLAVREINPRQVVLEGDGEKYEVLLSEKKKDQKTRQTAAASRGDDSGPRVISGGISSKKETVSAGSSASDGGRSEGGASPGSGSDSEDSKDSGSETEAEYKTIETPFGIIKKKIK